MSYKIVTKILANCIKDVIENLVDKEQSGFVPSRSPTDNIIVVQEIVHTINHERTGPFPLGS